MVPGAQAGGPPWGRGPEEAGRPTAQACPSF